MYIWKVHYVLNELGTPSVIGGRKWNKDYRESGVSWIKVNWMK